MNTGQLKWVLLGIFLIITGLSLLGVGLGGILSVIAGVCALIAGILFIINRQFDDYLEYGISSIAVLQIDFQLFTSITRAWEVELALNTTHKEGFVACFTHPLVILAMAVQLFWSDAFSESPALEWIH